MDSGEKRMNPVAVTIINHPGQAPVVQSVAYKTRNQEVAGSNLWLGQYSFRGSLVLWGVLLKTTSGKHG